MRYTADEEGFLKEVSFGADFVSATGESILYEGTVPDGYDTISDWYTAEEGALYHWKVVDGSLVLDSAAIPPENDISDVRTYTYVADIAPNWLNFSGGGYYTNVQVEGIKPGDNPICDVCLTDVTEQNAKSIESWGKITRITTAENTITLYANEEAPTSEFTVQVKVVR